MYKAQWAKETELRELREEVRRLKSASKTPAVQSEETGEEVKTEEDCKMEVDSEAESRQKLDQRKRQIAKQLRKFEEFTSARRRSSRSLGRGAEDVSEP